MVTGLPTMHLGCTGEPMGPKGLAPLLTATAAAATAGATVGAVGDIEELGENASFRVYDPPPVKNKQTNTKSFRSHKTGRY